MEVPGAGGEGVGAHCGVEVAVAVRIEEHDPGRPASRAAHWPRTKEMMCR